MRRRAPRRITATYLERYTLHYLERYVTTGPHLRRLLRRRVARSSAHHEVDPAEGYRLVDALIVKLEEVGLINDRRYAEDRARALNRRGAGRRQIVQALAAKGLRGALVDAALAAAGIDDDAELRAAATYARKRRIGPWRERPVDQAGRQKELAKLARRGFSYAVASRVIDAEDWDDQSR